MRLPYYNKVYLLTYLHKFKKNILEITNNFIVVHCREFDILDSMIQKLEKYADNLENVVEQRTAELIDEKQKTDMLLHRMLPA